MAERTPGPWQSRFLFRMIRRVRESPGDLLIVSPPENDWGEACLMAAAPDLLDRLSVLVAAVERGVVLEHHVRSAKVAIARAEGRTDA
jgi:hypothetical protein